jgi:hypothetical protein
LCYARLSESLFACFKHSLDSVFVLQEAFRVFKNINNRVSQNRFFLTGPDEVGVEASNRGQLIGEAASMIGQRDQQKRDVSNGVDVPG